MKTRRVLRALILAGMILAAGSGHGEPLRPLQVLPEQLAWTLNPAGYQQAVIVGDPDAAGMYAMRVKFPPGLRIAPHFHPDERIVVVLSGTVYFAYGEEFDETRLRAFPAGSVWTEPARQPHFARAGDAEVVLEVVGNGPSGAVAIPTRR